MSGHIEFLKFNKIIAKGSVELYMPSSNPKLMPATFQIQCCYFPNHTYIYIDLEIQLLGFIQINKNVDKCKTSI
jgi:hypothetical protein